MTFIDYKLTTLEIKNILRSAKKVFKKHSLFVRKSYTKRGTLSFTPTPPAEERLKIPLDKSFILMLSRYRKRKALTT
jgi:hypothetical protein